MFSKIKILQCVYSMNRGGVETWLMHVLRTIDRNRYHMDFVVHTSLPGSFDSEIRALGSSIYVVKSPAYPFKHFRDIEMILLKNGPYDVIHSHDATFNGAAMKIGYKCGIPLRIIHSHSDVRKSLPSNLINRLYTQWSIIESKRHANVGLACSTIAAHSYYGNNWQHDPRWRVLSYSESFAPFHDNISPIAIRRELGFPEDSFIIGHVGSFRDGQKNHSLIIKITQQLSAQDPSIFFLLIGEGILRKEIERMAAQAGIANRIIFTGSRNDVPHCMLGAMNVFLFPSLYEGLGLVMVEAQAAGLPCLCSDVVPHEADIVPELVKRIPLSESPANWAKTLIAMKNSPLKYSKQKALELVEKSNFNISTSIKTLEALYSLSKDSKI